MAPFKIFVGLSACKSTYVAESWLSSDLEAWAFPNQWYMVKYSAMIKAQAEAYCQLGHVKTTDVCFNIKQW